MSIVRYSQIENASEPREIVLLKALPCKWGKCSFCNYIEDNSQDLNLIEEVNLEVLRQVTGKFKVLQVINSGSCFELPERTIAAIQSLVVSKNLQKLFFEAHWLYRERLQEFKNKFEIPLVFITGIETFDENFRNQVLGKGINFKDVAEVKKYFDSICLMIGMKGQTREMIDNDIKILLENFAHGTINLFMENGTAIRPDYELQNWFRHKYAWLEAEKKVDVLWKNTDFGVGSPIDD